MRVFKLLSWVVVLFAGVNLVSISTSSMYQDDPRVVQFVYIANVIWVIGFTLVTLAVLLIARSLKLKK